MTLPRLVGALTSTLLLACIPASKPLGDADTEDGDTTATSTAGDDPGSSSGLSGTSAGPGPGSATDSGGTDGAETGQACAGRPCGPCQADCVCTEECIDGEWVCEVLNCEGSTGEVPTGTCDMEQTACDIADDSKVVPIDCGVATLADDLAHWQQVHDCALDNASTQDGFKAVFDLQGIDSQPRRAYVGQVGFVYALSELDQDLGGLGDPLATITQRPCTGLTFTPDCQVGVGQLCIQCLSSGRPGIICQEGGD